VIDMPIGHFENERDANSFKLLVEPMFYAFRQGLYCGGRVASCAPA